MNFRVILLITLLVGNIFAFEFDPSNLSKDEVKMLKQIKKEGAKYGLSYSLMAIAIKESSIGKYLVNVNSKDFGLYQANIKTVINRQKVKDTSWNRNKLAMKLISNFEFATQNAIAELKYWKKVHKSDWRRVWGSYNGGWSYNSKRARKYSREIASIVRKLRQANV
ncbi:MAG: transglycosylase SLT domain-containing protein [Campylobacterota bacterium]